jgi:hypothetical protein
MKNQPLLILGVASLGVLWLLYRELGGIEGIRNDPNQAFGVTGIFLVLAIPLFRWRYRALQREYAARYLRPRDPAPGAPVDKRLGSMAFVLEASRIKTLALFSIVIVGGTIGAWALLKQPGVCREAGLASIVPIILWGIVMAIGGLIRPERLEIASWGLKHVAFWSSREWPWEEVRNVTVMRANMFGRAWSSGLFFNRFVSQASVPGPARPFFRAIWLLPAHEIARVLNEARARWTPAGTSNLVPAKGNAADYLVIAFVLFSTAVLSALMYFHPCGI